MADNNKTKNNKNKNDSNSNVKISINEGIATTSTMFYLEVDNLEVS